MKQLVKFEIYKLFRQKGIYTWMILMFLFFSLAMTMEARIPNNLDTSAIEIKEELQTAAKKWEGKLTGKKIEEASNLSQSLEARVQQKFADNYKGDGNELTSEEVAEYFILSRISLARYNLQVFQTNLKDLDNRVNSVNRDSFAYKKGLLEQEMLEKVNVETFTYNEGPKKTIDFVSNYAVYFTGIIMLVGLTSTFVNETRTSMDQLIYSSRYGRKQIVTAKIMAGMALIVVLTISWVTFDVLMNLYLYGNNGWNSSIQLLGHPHSPYNLTGLEYFGIQIGAHLIAAIAFMAFILTVSALSKSILASFLISTLVFILPSIFLHSHILEFARKYSFISFMEAFEFRSPFHAINVFGVPVLDPYIHYPLLVLITAFFMFVTYQIIRRKQVQ
ncbi:hypothetical protein WAK64_07215 [Bacillus spongiae]|uniref:ABC transporter permease n=1 Tax=Bacillus spongiae TaxID=2683610 RepID=A0ABU8HC75_9BACI